MHLPDVTVSMRVMSAGSGYQYLLKSVAAGDGDRRLSTPLTRYYAETGTPPGRWLGSGLPGLGQGRVGEGTTVSEPQLHLLLGMGRDPVTGVPLGQAYEPPVSTERRIARRIGELPSSLGPGERAEAVTRIEADEQARGTRRVVAGFDYTLSVPKSVSALWAVADAGIQELIVRAHHEAVADVVDLMEREVLATRIGQGGVGQVETHGLVATAFDHYDSRAGDPQLHTHVVIANKTQGADGVWRAIDGRPMHAAVVGLSEHYNAVLADKLTVLFGLDWEAHERGRDRNSVWEIAAVSEDLITMFSSRSQAIETETRDLIEAYVDRHRRQPSKRAIIRLRQQATLATRPEKQVKSLAELTATWRAQATELLGVEASTWADEVTSHRTPVIGLRADDVPGEVVGDVAAVVVAQVGQRRSTWRHWNLVAEASRQTMGMRFATCADREAIIGMLVEAAEHQSLALTPPELVTVPEAFRRQDGSSVFRPRHATVFSSEELLAAEDRLLALAADRTGPTVTENRLATALAEFGGGLGEDQRGVVAQLATSGRILDVLIGPAGTGKTTTLAALRAAWESEHGKGSVIGLAPSAAAAQVLAADLGIGTENTAKWLHDHHAGNWNLRARQLVLVDEASLAGTLTLDALTAHAAEVGAKVVLVGDWAQLAAIDSGGAFGMLVRERDDTPELTEVRRFHAEWEKTASLHLRLGHREAITAYATHDRLHDGDTDQMVEAAYQGWSDDLNQGRSSVLIAESREMVTELNTRARLDRITTGDVHPDGARLHDGTLAGTGDLIVTRRNDRRLTTGRGWVKNGDRWEVLRHHDDGSLTVRRHATKRGGTLTLPAAYVRDDVELAYATTSHRAQGLTVDTAHVIVDNLGMTREALYVALTRGRNANHAYVATDAPGLEPHQLAPHDEPTAASVLAGILRHEGAEKSAHETITSEQDTWTGIDHLAAQYETIAQTAQAERFTTALTNAGLPAGEVKQITDSDLFGPLIADLRAAQAAGHDPENLLHRAVSAGDLDKAENPGTLLRFRVNRLASRPLPAPGPVSGRT